MSLLLPEVATLARPRAGERVCGDQALITRVGQKMVFALADGLGHGEAAAAASQAACHTVERQPGLDLVGMLHACDEALRGTRGAAVTLFSLDLETGELLHAGIGNVELTSASVLPVRAFPRPGVVGSRLRKVLETRHLVQRGDLLVAHTDGISDRLQLEPYRSLPVGQIAEALLRDWGKDHDDATCIVIRC